MLYLIARLFALFARRTTRLSIWIGLKPRQRETAPVVNSRPDRDFACSLVRSSVAKTINQESSDRELSGSTLSTKTQYGCLQCNRCRPRSRSCAYAFARCTSCARSVRVLRSLGALPVLSLSLAPYVVKRRNAIVDTECPPYVPVSG